MKYATRQAVDAELDRLDHRLQELLAEVPRDEVLDAFAAEAESLVEQPPAELNAYVQERVHDMLISAGLITDDPAGG